MTFRLLLLASLLSSLSATAAPTDGEIEPTLGISLAPAGRIQPRAASEIAASNWSIGGETLDRDFADYDQYKKYLGPLGAKAIRLQAGWAKTEREKGVYDWAWLDAIVDDAIAQGVRPWLNLSYGNPIYPGGGGSTLAAGLPSSPEAREAWLRWASATVQRYRDRVNEWEIWNEPDLGGRNNPDAYLALYIPTAEMIRAEQPGGRVYALSLAGNADFATAFLSALRDQNKLGLVDAITVHGYPLNPSETGSFNRWRTLAGRFSGSIQIRQGETGAPSYRVSKFAHKNRDWTETLQAKWNLCRMLTHFAHDMPFNLFTLSDLHYEGSRHSGANPKGLLRACPDKTISYAKPAYFAAQNVFAILDANWKNDPALRIDVPGQASPNRVSRYGLSRSDTGAAGVLFWFGHATPGADNTVAPIDLTVSGARFREPVCVDLRTGMVYTIPAAQWKQTGASATFTALPIYDSPMLLAEASSLPLRK